MNGERIQLKESRRRVVIKQRTILCFLAVILISVFGSIFGSMLTSAHGNQTEEPVNYTYYKSIEIQEGDTLWSIAESYLPDTYESVEEYVTDLKSINTLSSDDIHANMFLTVSYTDTKFQ